MHVLRIMGSPQRRTAGQGLAGSQSWE
uniref:Uncharacterized protein n=1 Tax=Anguilla anguilla TaxID=7936 RepID=A0A0E9SFU1_ANGAN